MGKKCDFGGWATRYNIKCADGLTIQDGAFDDCDGKTVPLVWNHQHDSSMNVLGHALLHCKDGGVYADITLNDTIQGKNARELVKNGDINSLSIYANKLKKVGSSVTHGLIREVSLVLAGANPGAFIDTAIAHSEDGVEPEEAIIYNEDGSLELEHSDISSEESKNDDTLEHSDEKETKDMRDKNRKPEGERTVQDIFNTLNEEQKTVVYYMIGQALEEAGKESDVEHSGIDDDYEEDSMKHNIFDTDSEGGIIRHSLTDDEQATIIADMKRFGSLKESYLQHKEEMGIENILAHSTDIEYSSDTQGYMVNDPSFLFPEARSLNNPPEWIKRDTEWVTGVIAGTKHTPFSRVKSVFADITEDEARAKGYIKGHLKKEEVFSLLKRTTTPTTIYKKQKMDRDDVVDITDFDVISWIRGEMRVMLNEEIARAILVGDGRLASSDDKINEANVRPIWTDVDLFTIKQGIDVSSISSEDDKAKAYIRALVKARKDYKGSGNLTFFTTEDVLTDMLLLEDNMGHRLYKSEAEVAAAMRVSKIVTVPIMEGLTRNDDGTTKSLVGIAVNLSDYVVGADKGGEINMFEDFDIDYNQQKYLIETRISGALVKPYSAIVVETYTA